jgi:hypothetical protein
MMLSNPMRPLLLLLVPLAPFACDPQAGPEYQGEPLATLRGTVLAGEASSGENADVAIAWLTSDDVANCGGPVLECSFGGGGMDGAEFECFEACGQPLACEEEALQTWTACAEQCGATVTANYSISWELCTSSAVGERVGISGSFPAQFRLDLYGEPPPEAILEDDTGARLAFGYLIVLEEGAEFDFTNEYFEAGAPGLLGLSSTDVLVYAETAVAADSPWGQLIGGAIDPGFHVIDVIDGGKECDDPEDPDTCWHDPDMLVPSPDGVDADITLELGWPSSSGFPHP